MYVCVCVSPAQISFKVKIIQFTSFEIEHIQWARNKQDSKPTEEELKFEPIFSGYWRP